jgi:hypothetical protein
VFVPAYACMRKNSPAGDWAEEKDVAEEGGARMGCKLEEGLGGLSSTRPATEETVGRPWLESAKLEPEGQACKGLERPTPVRVHASVFNLCMCVCVKCVRVCVCACVYVCVKGICLRVATPKQHFPPRVLPPSLKGKDPAAQLVAEWARQVSDLLMVVV